MVSHFDEKSGVVPCGTEWGRWWQNVDEVHVEIISFKNLKAKDVSIKITPSTIKCSYLGEIILEGKLFRPVHADEAVWTIEDNGSLLNIVLPKADYAAKEIVWEALTADEKYHADPVTLHEMRKKLDLEKFQIENPGFDFSNAKLSKSYDKAPEQS
ncbi:nudC domain-containing protein 2-like [Planococcus citri]|uniref:nudC domain-containing protein 2-like n=1 Tax=Planococcus citri TaxID=170843 RepID=UPI0031F86CCE